MWDKEQFLVKTVQPPDLYPLGVRNIPPHPWGQNHACWEPLLRLWLPVTETNRSKKEAFIIRIQSDLQTLRARIWPSLQRLEPGIKEVTCLCLYGFAMCLSTEWQSSHSQRWTSKCKFLRERIWWDPWRLVSISCLRGQGDCALRVGAQPLNPGTVPWEEQRVQH